MREDSQPSHNFSIYWSSYPRGEDIQICASLLLSYYGDGKSHPAFWHRSFRYAVRLLGMIMGGIRGGQTARLSPYWHMRLKEFGLKWYPDTGELEVIDSWRWMHAVSILRQTGRLPYSTFLNRLSAGEHWSKSISAGELPPKFKIYKKSSLKFGDQNFRNIMEKRMEERSAGDADEYNPVKKFISGLYEDM